MIEMVKKTGSPALVPCTTCKAEAHPRRRGARPAPTRRAAALAFATLAVAAPACTAPPARAGATPGRFDAMLLRPLFSPNRRPPPPPMTAPALAAPVAPPVSLPPPSIALSGVISGGGIGVALIRRPQDAVPIRVALGGQVDGWTVAEIRPRAIVLRRDDRSVVISLPAP